MKRRIVKHGKSTLTISLPSSWVKKNNLKPKSDIEVEEKGPNLIIKTKKGEEFLKTSLDIKDNYKTGIRYICSFYRKGCDELHISYDDPSYLARIEQCLAEDILGYEIVKNGKTWCVIKDIPGTKFEGFNTLINRIWIMLTSIANDLYESMKEKDKATIEGIKSLDTRINKFTNYCIRVLNKKGHPDYKNIPIYYRLLRELEEIGDLYKYLALYYLSDKSHPSKVFLNRFRQVNLFLITFRKLFYKPDDSITEKLLLDTLKIHEDFGKYFKRMDAAYFHYLFMINDRIRKLLSSIIEMKILKNTN